jgi:hypothetical protein
MLEAHQAEISRITIETRDQVKDLQHQLTLAAQQMDRLREEVATGQRLVERWRSACLDRCVRSYLDQSITDPSKLYVPTVRYAVGSWNVGMTLCGDVWRVQRRCLDGVYATL